MITLSRGLFSFAAAPLLLLAGAVQAASFLQNGQGLVSIEAENAHRNIAQGSDQWTPESSPGGFSGTGVMVASPDNGTRVSSGFTTNSPQLDFDVTFTETGTHYLWIRANAQGFGGDSVHAGLNDQETPTATNIFLPGGGYTWSGGSETITVQSTGLHTINLWMREDGSIIDKIVLTTDASFVPTDIGPSESPQGSGGNQPPVTQNDTFSVLQGSSATNLAVLANNGNGADADPNGDPLTVLSVGATSNGGTAVVNGGGNGVTYTPQSSFTGQETFSYTISDGKGGSDSAQVTVNVNPTGGGNGEFLQDGQGLVSMEAENAHRNIPQGSDQWTPESSPGGFSGTGVMVALPDNGTRVTSGFTTNSPQLDFDVTFTETGTHYLWIRGNGQGGDSNSVHAGLDGQETTTAAGISLLSDGYFWSGGSETITVQSTGLHTINLWMREDGSIIDKIVLTTDASFVPTDIGPSESPQGSGGNQPPVTQNDTFSVLQGSSATNLAVLANNGNGADADPNGDPLTVLSVGATSNGGTAVVNGGGNGVTYTPQSSFTGQETFSYTISDGKGGSDSAQVTVNVNPTGGGNGEFLQDGQGLVSMEAENAHRNIPQGSDQWTPESSPGGFSGTGVMVALPDNGTRVTSGFTTNSPQLDFDVTFTETGTHYLWIRGNGQGGDSNSVHAGLDGQETTTAAGISLLSDGYFWSGGSETITVQSTGLHTINLWMREDGSIIDKIVLTTDASFVPTDIGPAESAQVTVNVNPVGGSNQPQDPLISIELSSSEQWVPRSGSVTISWQSSGATSCTASGDWSGTKPVSGTVRMDALSEDKVYKLTCENETTTSVTLMKVYIQQAVLSWEPPTENSDDSALARSDLDGYRVYWGTASGTYENALDVEDPAQTTLVLKLTPGTYYFAITAINTDGEESLFSTEGRKVIK